MVLAEARSAHLPQGPSPDAWYNQALPPTQREENKTHNHCLPDGELLRGSGGSSTLHPLTAWLQARPSPCSSPGHHGVWGFGTLRDRGRDSWGSSSLAGFPHGTHRCRTPNHPLAAPLCPTPLASPGCCLRPPAGSSCWKIIKDSRDWKRSKVAHSFQ